MIVARSLLCDAAIFHRHFHDGAAVELPHGRTVKLLPGRGTLGHGWQALFLALGDLFLTHQHVTAARGEVDADSVSGPQPRESATRSALRRAIQNGGTVR